MAQVQSVQTGEVAITGATDTATISAVIVSQSFVLISVEVDSNRADNQRFSVELTNSTTLTFRRGTSGATATIRYWVVEMDASVTVQHSGGSASGGTATNVAISLVDTTAAIVIGNLSRASSSTHGNDDVATFQLTSPTNVEIQNGLFGPTLCEFQAIEWTGATAQRGSVTPTGTTETVAISPVALSNTWLTCSNRGTASRIDLDAMPAIEGNSSTQIQLRTGGSLASGAEYCYELLEFGDATTVQEVSSFTQVGGTPESTAAISAIDTADSVPFSSLAGAQGGLIKTAANDEADNGYGRATFLDATTLSVEAAVAWGNDAPHQVLEFDSGGGSPPLLGDFASTAVSDSVIAGRQIQRGHFASQAVSSGTVAGSQSSTAEGLFHGTATSSGLVSGRQRQLGDTTSQALSSGLVSGRRVARGLVESLAASSGVVLGRQVQRGSGVSTALSSGFASGIQSGPGASFVSTAQSSGFVSGRQVHRGQAAGTGISSGAVVGSVVGVQTGIAHGLAVSSGLALGRQLQRGLFHSTAESSGLVNSGPQGSLHHVEAKIEAADWGFSISTRNYGFKITTRDYGFTVSDD